MPLKSYEDILVAFNHMLSNGLEIYLQKFLAPFMGDWPTQFFMRQLVYNLAEVSLPDICQNVVPLIGPLHISLNSRECVLTFSTPSLPSFMPPRLQKSKISKETRCCMMSERAFCQFSASTRISSFLPWSTLLIIMYH